MIHEEGTEEQLKSSISTLTPAPRIGELWRVRIAVMDREFTLDVTVMLILSEVMLVTSTKDKKKSMIKLTIDEFMMLAEGRILAPAMITDLSMDERKRHEENASWARFNDFSSSETQKRQLAGYAE